MQLSDLMEKPSETTNTSGEPVMEVGGKVIIYTVILRGNTQTSFAGTLLARNDLGITVETPGGRTFFPWTAIERVSF